MFCRCFVVGCVFCSREIGRLLCGKLGLVDVLVDSDRVWYPFLCYCS